MPRKLRVGVVYGGRSGEHLVSLASAASVLRALDSKRYEAIPIGITRGGQWRLGESPQEYLESGLPEPESVLPDPSDSTGGAPSPEGARSPEAAETASPLHRAPPGTAGVCGPLALSAEMSGRLDVVIPLIHGTYGEDGCLQGMFEMAGLPYVGAGVLASAVGMDKAVMKRLLSSQGLPVLECRTFRLARIRKDPGGVRAEVEAGPGFPCFVKPANGGSSVGMSRVASPDELAAALDEALAFDDKLIIEKALDCREIELAVLGNDSPQVSVPGELCFDADFYDYETKYTPGRMEPRVPAPLSPQMTRRVQELALAAYEALECEGMARVDLFLERQGEALFVNEINTIPGFTSESLYARLWEASGLSYPELLDRLIELALERHQRRSQRSGLTWKPGDR